MTFVRDKHHLYQIAVQDARRECGFIKRTYKALRDRFPRILREDFCGTANVSCAWVRQSGKQLAYGIDLCRETLDWGIEHNVARLTPPQREQVKLLQQDVRDPSDCAPDAICAYNFSYFTFWTRQSLQRYFESVRNSIAQDGLFFLDIFGGCDAHEPDTEVTEFDGFEFHWELAEFDPISHRVVFHIHFQPDQGEPMHRAFTYDWRYWTIPEIRELLAAAGFRDSRVYWQQSDEVTDEFNGEFRHQRIAINESGWLAYIVAIP